MKVLQTLVGVWKELQRFVMHKSAGTPAGMPEGGYYYDTAEHAPMYHDGTSVRPFGVTEHGKLEGLTEGDPHPQYVLGTEIGVSNGVASLDASGRVPAAQLPAFVDDVLEYASLSAFPATGESGKLYLALDTSMLYRWTGSTYAQIAPGGASLVLGETSSTAYRGDRGAQAYAHALQSGNPHGTAIVDISGLKTALDGKMDTASNPDLVAIEALAGTAGLLKKTAANTWALDTSTYATTSKLTDGSVTKVGTASVGSGTQPIFLNAGVPTASTATIGSASLPTYSNAGVITACGTTLGVSVTGNAATASKLATVRTIALSGDVTGSATFDGSANVSITTANNPQAYDYYISNSTGSSVFAVGAYMLTANIVSGQTHHAEAVLRFSVQGGSDAANNYAGKVYLSCKTQSTTPTYNNQILEGTGNIDDKLKWRWAQDSTRIYSVIMFKIPAYCQLFLNLESLRGGGTWTSTFNNMTQSTWTPDGTLLTYFVPNATNADTLDGYHLVIQPLSTTRTAPNTVFYCY